MEFKNPELRFQYDLAELRRDHNVTDSEVKALAVEIADGNDTTLARLLDYYFNDLKPETSHREHANQQEEVAANSGAMVVGGTYGPRRQDVGGSDSGESQAKVKPQHLHVVEGDGGFDHMANPWLESRYVGKQVKYSAPNLAAINWWLENDTLMDGVRLERMSQAITCDNGLPWDDGRDEWGEVDTDYLLEEMQRRYRHDGEALMGNSDGIVRRAVMMYVNRHSYDRLTEMLDDLPAWDGIERKDTILIDFLGAEDSAYTRCATGLFLHAALARAYQPGCKFDMMLTLKSNAQGIGKSTLFNKLAMTDDFFIDDVKGVGTKEAQELLQGCWIIEFAELKADKEATVDGMKQFITQKHDTYRVPYDHRPSRHPRRCVLVGTTNDATFLRDETGNRRFLPVFCDGHRKLDVMRDLTEEYVRQVWAEALVQYRANPNMPLVLPPDMEAEANRYREQATVEDVWAGLVEAYLEERTSSTVCNLQLLVDCIGMERDKVKRSHTMKMANIMARMSGWEKLPTRQNVTHFGKQSCYRYVG